MTGCTARSPRKRSARARRRPTWPTGHRYPSATGATIGIGNCGVRCASCARWSTTTRRTDLGRSCRRAGRAGGRRSSRDSGARTARPADALPPSHARREVALARHPVQTSPTTSPRPSHRPRSHASVVVAHRRPGSRRRSRAAAAANLRRSSTSCAARCAAGYTTPKARRHSAASRSTRFSRSSCASSRLTGSGRPTGRHTARGSRARLQGAIALALAATASDTGHALAGCQLRRFRAHLWLAEALGYAGGDSLRSVAVETPE